MRSTNYSVSVTGKILKKTVSVGINKMVKITEDEFGVTKLPASSGPEIVKRFTFTNTNGVIAQVSGNDKLKCDYLTVACSCSFIYIVDYISRLLHR